MSRRRTATNARTRSKELFMIVTWIGKRLEAKKQTNKTERTNKVAMRLFVALLSTYPKVDPFVENGHPEYKEKETWNILKTIKAPSASRCMKFEDSLGRFWLASRIMIMTKKNSRIWIPSFCRITLEELTTVLRKCLHFWTKTCRIMSCPHSPLSLPLHWRARLLTLFFVFAIFVTLGETLCLSLFFSFSLPLPPSLSLSFSLVVWHSVLINGITQSLMMMKLVKSTTNPDMKRGMSTNQKKKRNETRKKTTDSWNFWWCHRIVVHYPVRSFLKP